MNVSAGSCNIHGSLASRDTKPSTRQSRRCCVKVHCSNQLPIVASAVVQKPDKVKKKQKVLSFPRPAPPPQQVLKKAKSPGKGFRLISTHPATPPALPAKHQPPQPVETTSNTSETDICETSSQVLLDDEHSNFSQQAVALSRRQVTHDPAADAPITSLLDLSLSTAASVFDWPSKHTGVQDGVRIQIPTLYISAHPTEWATEEHSVHTRHTEQPHEPANFAGTQTPTIHPRAPSSPPSQHSKPYPPPLLPSFSIVKDQGPATLTHIHLLDWVINLPTPSRPLPTQIPDPASEIEIDIQSQAPLVSLQQSKTPSWVARSQSAPSTFHSWLSASTSKLNTHESLICSDPMELHPVIDECIQRQDTVGATAAVVRLVHLTRNTHRRQAAASEAQCTTTTDYLHRALDLASRHEASLSHSTVANLLWASAATHHPPTHPQMKALLSKFLTLLPTASPTSVAHTLTALVKLKHRPDPRFAASFFRTSHTCLPLASPHELITILNALSNLGLRPWHTWLDRCDEAIVSYLPSMSSSDAAALISAHAKMQVVLHDCPPPSPQHLDALLSVALSTPPTTGAHTPPPPHAAPQCPPSPDAHQNSCAQGGETGDMKPMGGSMQGTTQGASDSQVHTPSATVAALGWALGTLHHPPSPTALNTLLTATTAQQASFNIPQLSHLLWGLARVRATVPPDWVLQVLDTVLDTVLAHTPSLQPNCLSMILWSVQRLNIPPPATFLTTALNAVEPHLLSHLSPISACNLVSALAGLGHVPDSQWTRTYCSAVQHNIEQYSGRELAKILCAVRSLGIECDASWVSSLLTRMCTQLHTCSVGLLCRTVKAAGDLGVSGALGASGACPDTAWLEMVLHEVDMRLAVDADCAECTAELLEGLVLLRYCPSDRWMSSCLPRVLPRAPLERPQLMTRIIDCLADMGYSPGSGWLHCAWMRVAPQQQQLQRLHLLRSFLSSARLHHLPPKPIRLAVFDCVYHGRMALDGDELARVALALAALAARPPRLWLLAFANAFRAKVSTCSGSLAATGLAAVTALCVRVGLQDVNLSEPLVEEAAMAWLSAPALLAALRSVVVLRQCAGDGWLQRVEAKLVEEAGGGETVGSMEEAVVLFKRLGYSARTLSACLQHGKYVGVGAHSPETAAKKGSEQ